jgi:hypothetical protein
VRRRLRRPHSSSIAHQPRKRGRYRCQPRKRGRYRRQPRKRGRHPQANHASAVGIDASHASAVGIDASHASAVGIHANHASVAGRTARDLPNHAAVVGCEQPSTTAALAYRSTPREPKRNAQRLSRWLITEISRAPCVASRSRRARGGWTPRIQFQPASSHSANPTTPAPVKKIRGFIYGREVGRR